ncbi:MAG: hypothetical protein JRD03_03680 [Deltaproteobacteria bacterium]|nr:hypothetical protein [Deltaproteobacteria bacterium]
MHGRLQFMTRTKSLLIVFVAVSLVGNVAFAKRNTPPKSFIHNVRHSDEIDQRIMAAVNVAALLEEDAAPTAATVPVRVAYAVPLDLGIDNAGTWETLPDGGSLWRLRVSSPGAVFMSFKFSDFELPEGAELYFVSVHRNYQDGAYTQRHNRPAKRFGSPMIPGDSAVIELYLPPGSASSSLQLESVSHGYRNAMGMGSIAARAGAPSTSGTSPIAAAAGPFSCQRDIACSEGLPYQDVKRAAAEGYDGVYICSGQLINNVRQDNRYLYITAEHCEWHIDPPTMAYYWNYENSGCGTNDAPLTFSTGSTDLYHDAAADIDLLELDGTDLESTYDVYFTGWNRSPTAPTMGAIISFPDDKPKQISIDNDPIIDCAPSGCTGGWGANWWRVEGYDVGVPEGGSSGGGLLDQNNLLVGVLSGGVGTNCNNFEWDEYAKIYPHWSSLQPFLDPDATGAISLPGKDAPEPGALLQLASGTAFLVFLAGRRRTRAG